MTEMEMYNLAEGNGPETASDRQPYYPSIRLMSDNAPEELIDKEVGHVCDLHVIAKKVSERALVNGKKEIVIELMQVGYLEDAGNYDDDHDDAK